MDAYFTELGRGAEHFDAIVQQVWQNYSPAERLALQQITREFAGDDVALGQEFARSQLLFAYVTDQAYVLGRAALADELPA
jgi:hypothetical protein